MKLDDGISTAYEEPFDIIIQGMNSSPSFDPCTGTTTCEELLSCSFPFNIVDADGTDAHSLNILAGAETFIVA